MSAIHSDYLRMYIELGFWGFVFWEWYTFLFMPKQMMRFGKNTFIAYTACTTYLAFTYFTDNTVMFFLVSVVYRLIPLCVAVIDSENREEAIRLE
jgi:toxin CptA